MTEDLRELGFDDGPKRIESIRWTQENWILTRDPLALGPDADTLTMSPNPGVLVCKPVCLGIPLAPRTWQPHCQVFTAWRITPPLVAFRTLYGRT